MAENDPLEGILGPPIAAPPIISLTPGAAAPATTSIPPGYGSGPVTGTSQLDKYQRAAVEDREKLAKAGYRFGGEDYSSRLAKGAGLGWADEINAAIGSPIYMARHGTFNPAEGYRYGKAAQDLTAAKMQENTEGPLGTALEIGGGLGSAGGIMSGTRAAARMIPWTSRAIPPALVNIGKGGAIGALAGSGEAKTLKTYRRAQPSAVFSGWASGPLSRSSAAPCGPPWRRSTVSVTATRSRWNSSPRPPTMPA
jgi:hypothetical protein